MRREQRLFLRRAHRQPALVPRSPRRRSRTARERRGPNEPASPGRTAPRHGRRPWSEWLLAGDAPAWLSVGSLLLISAERMAAECTILAKQFLCATLQRVILTVLCARPSLPDDCNKLGLMIYSSASSAPSTLRSTMGAFLESS